MGMIIALGFNFWPINSQFLGDVWSSSPRVRSLREIRYVKPKHASDERQNSKGERVSEMLRG